MKQGIHIDEITLFDYKISKLYIKWDKRVTITLQNFQKLSVGSTTELKVPNVYYILRVLYNTVERIEIEHFKQDQLEGTLLYSDKKLHISSNVFTLDMVYSINSEQVLSKEFQLEVHKYNLSLIGSMNLSSKQNELSIDALFDYNAIINGGVTIHYVNNRVFLTAKTSPISDLSKIEHALNLDPSINEWVFEKLTTDTLTIKDFSTSFTFDNLHAFVENIKGDFTLNNTSYKFDDALAPGVAKQVNGHFEKGDLHFTFDELFYSGIKILHLDVTLAHLSTNYASLLINQPTLKIDVASDHILSKPIVDILSAYDSEWKVEQLTGDTYATFAFQKNLITKQKTWESAISLKNASVDVYGLPLFIEDAYFLLHYKKITVQKLRLAQKGIYAIDFNGTIDAKNDRAKLNVTLDTLNLFGLKTLSKSSGTLDFKDYTTTVNLPSTPFTAFNLLDFNASSSQFTMDKNFNLSFSPILLSNPTNLDANISGHINLETFKNNLKLSVNTLKLNPYHTLFPLIVNSPFTVKTSPDSLLKAQIDDLVDISVGDHNLSLKGVQIDINDTIHSIVNSIKLDNILTANANFAYNIDQRNGLAHITNIQNNVKFNQEPVLQMKHTPIDINFSMGILPTAYIKPLNIDYTYTGLVHKLYFSNLTSLYNYSPLLQNYPKPTGHATVLTKDFEDFSLFTALKSYTIPGYINTDVNNNIYVKADVNSSGLFASINKDIHLALGDEIHLSLENNLIDLSALFKHSNDTHDSNKSTYGTKPITITAQDGRLIIGNHKQLLYDKAKAKLENDTFYATLNYQKGKVIIFKNGKNTQLFGENFSDKFISNLLNFDGFKKGTYSMYMQGTSKHLIGGIDIKGAIAKDFTLYSNIMGFLNAVPALITLQSPGFNSQGFMINTGAVVFDLQNNILKLTSLKFYGDTTNVFGSGSINLEKKTLDLTLRIMLLKDVGTIVSNIPIAGYLILGDDGSLGTTITVNGSLDKPNIEVNLGKDLVMAPVNIIKRTLNLPLQFLQWLNE